ncbi:hypothetical protein [Nonomuraea sp. NPDC049695]|uniref:hypothetical protein n=1 Tax=Nonomuraea sp. NPDC049695 TaxID=3154734 RepID=UPI003418F378
MGLDGVAVGARVAFAPLCTLVLRPAGVASRPGGGVSRLVWHVAALSAPGTAGVPPQWR